MDTDPNPPEGKPSSAARTDLQNHIVVVGHGLVGQSIVERLMDGPSPLVVVDEDAARLVDLRQRGVEIKAANGADIEVLKSLNLSAARQLFVTIPGIFIAGSIVSRARAENPGLMIVARAHSDADAGHLRRLGATAVVQGDQQVARAMLYYLGEPPDPNPAA